MGSVEAPATGSTREIPIKCVLRKGQELQETGKNECGLLQIKPTKVLGTGLEVRSGQCLILEIALVVSGVSPLLPSPLTQLMVSASAPGGSFIQA